MNDIHPNSVEACHTIDRETRRKNVLAVYQAMPKSALTDREVANAMGFKDLNMARPRITELVKSGTLSEIGKVKDFLTGKTVRQCCLADKQMRFA